MIMKTIVIEDDPAARLLLKRLLTRFFPHNVLDAADGETGWRMVEAERPAVIFCDIYMPELNGVEFLERLRAHPELSHTPVIAISAARDPDLVRRLVELGVADYLLKPIPLEATVKRLAKLLPPMLAAAEARKSRPRARPPRGNSTTPPATPTPTEATDLADIPPATGQDATVEPAAAEAPRPA